MLGVHRRAEIANFEVQVLARGVPGGAREPEYRLDGDRIGLQHAHLAEVCVKGAPAITAIDDHVVAVARGVTGRRDRASAGARDGCVARNGEIDPAVDEAGAARGSVAIGLRGPRFQGQREASARFEAAFVRRQLTFGGQRDGAFEGQFVGRRCGRFARPRGRGGPDGRLRHGQGSRRTGGCGRGGCRRRRALGFARDGGNRQAGEDDARREQSLDGAR